MGDSYRGGPGRLTRTSDATRAALVASMNLDGSTEDAAKRSLEQLASQARDRVLDPCRVASTRDSRRIPVHFPPDADGPLEWEIDVELETGERIGRRGRRALSAATANLPLGAELPPGYHDVTVRLSGSRVLLEKHQKLIVTPASATPPAAVLGDERVFGLVANLYSVRETDDLGVGDVHALERLIDWTAARGGSFVGVNPLCAQRIRDGDVSPYAPSSRIFGSAVYVDLAAVPELRGTRELRRIAAAGFGAIPGGVDYLAVLERKQELLSLAHRRFGRAGPARRRAFERFVRDGGETLRDFATFEALHAQLRAEGRHHGTWRTWPRELRDPRSPSVDRFRGENFAEVERHLFVQFELARQLDRLQTRARRRGMRIGLYHDLPVGVSSDGADSWSWQGAFAEGARIGAPPDDFQPDGQDWGLPPLLPHRMGELGYLFWANTVRATFAAAGAVRIDHAMGLVRQYWVTGQGAERCGAYVAQPFEGLMGIVALESARKGALVIGEDLGTVPAGFRTKMTRAGALSMRILYFERTPSGGFRSARSYPRKAFVSANTHDLATLPAFWEGRDIELAAKLARAKPSPARRRARERDRAALVRRLRAEGAVTTRAEPSTPAVVAAVHRHLAATPSALFAVSLDDLAGETEPVNLPGVGSDVYPSWTRRLARPLSELVNDPAVGALLDAARRVRSKQAPRPEPSRKASPPRPGARRRSRR